MTTPPPGRSLGRWWKAKGLDVQEAEFANEQNRSEEERRELRPDQDHHRAGKTTAVITSNRARTAAGTSRVFGATQMIVSLRSKCRDRDFSFLWVDGEILRL